MDTGTTIGIVLAVLAVGVGIGRSFASGVQTPNPFAQFGLSVPLKIFHYFLPYSLILYSFINDIIFEANMYWPAPLIALGVALLNSFVSNRFISANLGKMQSDLCTIPGLSSWTAYELPQMTVFTTTLLGYISMFNTTIQLNKGSEYTKIIPPWILLGAFSLMQYGMMLKDGCFGDDITKGNFNILGSSFVNWLLAVIVGTGIGAGAGYGITKSSLFAEGASGSPSFTSTGPAKPPMAKSSDPNVGTCSAPNDQDQFVCEAYKNGELVTSTVVENFVGK
jgi:hypothetical protein